MEIRLAISEDIPTICQIIQQLTPGKLHDYREAVQKFESHILPSPDYFLWVAVVNGKVIGTAMMHLQHKLSYHCGTAAHLEDVVIDQEYRGRGIGEALVRCAIETAKERKCYKLMLTCFEKTAVYYGRLGFEKHDIGMRIDLKEHLYEEIPT